jgi:hypothetical protein
MNTIAMWHEHARSNAAERRVRVLFEASRHFTKRLQKYLREPWKGEKREIVGACWSRAFEWTLGDDTLGHPHFHLWALEPWIPLEDEHRIESVIDGVRRPTTPCKAQGDAKHAKRAKTCELCAAKVERRTGMRTWWSSGLAQSGVELASENVIIDIREMQAHPMRAFREVRKPLGVNYQGRDEHNPIARAKAYVKSIEMRTAAGEVVNYFENWNMARLDEETLRLAGPSVIGGVARALEGRRMSQASKVVLLKNKREPKGETMRVGFYGIADSYYGGECESCKAAGGERLPSKGVRVVSWQQKVAARVEAHAPTPMPVDTGPPPHDAEAAYRDLVHRLQVAEAGASGVLAKLEDVCAAVRELGADVLPIYRRGRVRKGPIVWTAREKMKHAARVARKNKAG